MDPFVSAALGGAATALSAAVLFGLWKGLRWAEKTAKASTKQRDEFIAALRVNAIRTAELTAEFRFIRQGAMQPGAPPTAPAPPVGQPSTMPPAYPVWDFSRIPDARPDDTDRGALEQTDEDLMLAQQREEAAARGIELDSEDLPRDAVREEAD